MPVMKHLNVGGTTYDTVGEASVTQVLSSGTKIATVSIDGTSTDLYAPEGGGGGGIYDLVIHVTLNDAMTAATSHDADSSECIAFVEAIVSGDDLNAVAICRKTAYDDEDDVYSAGSIVLPLVDAYSTSYGMGQYEVDGGWTLTFVSINNVTSAGKASGFMLTVHGVNDDPQLAPTVTFYRL